MSDPTVLYLSKYQNKYHNMTKFILTDLPSLPHDLSEIPQTDRGLTMAMQVFGDIVEANGKTIRENNLAIQHKFPLGSIVTVDFEETQHIFDSRPNIGYKGTATLYVVKHARDCDGTPLYALSDRPVAPVLMSDTDYFRWKALVNFFLHGYGEDSLQDTGNKAEVFYTNFQDYVTVFLQ